MSLSNDDRKALVDYRIEKARATFDEAQKVKNLMEKLIALNKLAD